MSSLNENIQEIYSKDGKNILELVQEWINENNSIIYCNNNAKDVKYSCR